MVRSMLGTKPPHFGHTQLRQYKKYGVRATHIECARHVCVLCVHTWILCKCLLTLVRSASALNMSRWKQYTHAHIQCVCAEHSLRFYLAHNGSGHPPQTCRGERRGRFSAVCDSLLFVWLRRLCVCVSMMRKQNMPFTWAIYTGFVAGMRTQQEADACAYRIYMGGV